jgi:hypothetical protein
MNANGRKCFCLYRVVILGEFYVHSRSFPATFSAMAKFSGSRMFAGHAGKFGVDGVSVVLRGN